MMGIFSKIFLTMILSIPTLSWAYDVPKDTGKLEVSVTNYDLLKRFSVGLAEIAKLTKKSLVFISVSKSVSAPNQIDPFEFFFGPGPGGQRPNRKQKQEGLGSGFFIDLNKGYILTNNHVVEDADEISIKLANGGSYSAKVVGRDKNTDVAVVKIQDEKFDRNNLGQLILSEGKELDVGELVVALGAPFGLESSISFGVISATGRGNLQITQLGNFIQTDAAINPGNSGGPLVGMDGKVVGINTAIFSKSGAYNGIGFAVPAKLVRSIASKLINNGAVKRGFIGVGMQPLTDELREGLGIAKTVTGTLVAKVEANSPAGKAGIQEGDVLLEVNGSKIHNESDLTNAVGLSNPGDKIEISLLRGNQNKNLTVTVGDWPGEKIAGQQARPGKDGAKGNTFGLTVENLTSELKTELGADSSAGAVVTEVDENSTAAKAGMQPGDIIVAVNGQKTSSAKQFDEQSRSQKRLLLRIERQGSYAYVSLKK